MNYNKVVESIDREIKFQLHFTDYDFGEILGIKCPRPEKAELLRNEYINIMIKVKFFLKTEPTKESLRLFIMDYVLQLDSSRYFEEEFKLLILKINGFNYFTFGIGDIKDYYDLKWDKLTYAI